MKHIICIFAPTMENGQFNGLNKRHLSQIIRRKMTQKCKNSKKVYNRSTEKKIFQKNLK